MKVSVTKSGIAAPQFIAQDAPESPSADTADSEAARTGRAVVPVKAIETKQSLMVSGHRTSAPFLAQLIATERQLPQTRERRRAAPREAIAAYKTVSARVKVRAR
jgi:hypothetical protein